MRLGDVYHYDSQERPDRWCREEVAVAIERGGGLVLADTFWDLSSETHILTEQEMATAVLLFNTGDYRALDRHESWDDYDRNDCRQITSQHGLQRTRYVRIGAQPSDRRRLENAVDKIIAAGEALESAAWRLELAHGEYERILPTLNDHPSTWATPD